LRLEKQTAERKEYFSIPEVRTPPSFHGSSMNPTHLDLYYESLSGGRAKMESDRVKVFPGLGKVRCGYPFSLTKKKK